MTPAMGLTVAVTGPTGEIGVSAVRAIERSAAVERVIGMARREFDPAERGWTKTEYRQGDVLDHDAVDALVADADVVVHLAYLIMGSREQSRQVNLAGTRNVFEATVAAKRPSRLVYTSSVAAYGYHRDNPLPLTEDVPTRGSAEHYYSAQKAECEQVLHEVTDGSGLEVYVLRPCIVAGPEAPALREKMPWQAALHALPAALQSLAATVAGSLPLLPDPGVPVQLVHHDDVAEAIALCVAGAGEPGAYNIAGAGEVSLSDVAAATGTRSVRVPQAAAVALSQGLARLPLVPAAAEWLHLGRTSVVMDTTRAREVLGWTPQYSAADTLATL
ncbi:MAG TPA: NAD-dependent epimerase/dehydratase family protein [Jatrophihabitans sp.]